MEANELRIGNWVDYNDRVYQVDSGTFIDNSINNCMPIPLTEEWLIKFGFELFKDKTYTIERDDKWKTKFSIWHNEENKCFCIAVQNFLYGFEYVHTLQNLYFALTGEELSCE